MVHHGVDEGDGWFETKLLLQIHRSIIFLESNLYRLPVSLVLGDLMNPHGPFCERTLQHILIRTCLYSYINWILTDLHPLKLQ